MGFLSDIIGVAAPIAGAYFGGPVGAAVGSGVAGLIGNDKAYGQEQAAAQAARTAANPVSVFGPGGNAVFRPGSNSYKLSVPDRFQKASDAGILGGRRALDQYEAFNPAGYDVNAEVRRLRKLRAPDIAQARSQLQSQLLSRGRLGVGVGGGRTGGLFQPETKALEEAILNSQLSDISSAQDRAMQREALDYDREGQLLANAQGLFNIGGALQGGGQGAAQLGVQARLPTGIAALQATPGNNQASSTRGFFSGLGATDWGSIFGDEPQQHYPTDYRNDIYT